MSSIHEQQQGRVGGAGSWRGGVLRYGLAAVAVALVLALVWWLWGAGGAARVSAWAAAGQGEVQRAMAEPLRAIRRGDLAALAGLLGLCFAYGFFHAAGPGHGKLLIGGYGMGRSVPMLRLSLLALGSSLAQSATAVVMVALGGAVFQWSRQRMTDMADNMLEPLSYAAVALVGLWLALRGARRLWRMWRGGAARARQARVARGAVAGEVGAGAGAAAVRPFDRPFDLGAETGDGKGAGSENGHAQAHHHGHRSEHSAAHDGLCSHGLGLEDHAHGEECGCGHAHGPSLEQVERVHSLRDALMLIGAVAIRPCTGALFVLILCFAMGMAWVGIAAAFAMGLGTASVTVAVGLLSVFLRRRALSGLGDGRRMGMAQAAVELGAGAIIALLAAQFALAAL